MGKPRFTLDAGGQVGLPEDAPLLIDSPGRWKPGVTINGYSHRPFLNGEPCPGAVEADAGKGTVTFAPDRAGAVEVRHGRVEIRPAPQDE